MSTFVKKHSFLNLYILINPANNCIPNTPDINEFNILLNKLRNPGIARHNLNTFNTLRA